MAEITPTNQRKGYLEIGLRAGVTLAFCAILLAIVDLREVGRRMAAADLGYLLAALFFALASMIFMARRWQLMMRHDGTTAPWWLLFIYYVESSFFGLFLPSAIGGDVFRGLQVHRQMGGARRTGVNLFTERLIGIWSVCLLGAAGLACFPLGELSISRAVVVAYAVIIAATLMLLSRRAQGLVSSTLIALRLARAAEIHDLTMTQFRNYLAAPRLLAELFLISLLQQFAIIISTWYIGLAAGIHLGIAFYMMAMPIIWLASLIPAIGGTGPREGSFAYLLIAAGAGRDAAVAAAGLLLAVTIARGLIGGLVALRRLFHPST